MHIEQIYTGCLAQGAYYIESDGEAAVIDPLRETEPYLQRARERGARIKYIFETHFHADFVSGHLDLASKSGATIVYGPKADTGYEKYNAADGEELKLGKLTIQVIHTPGHTPESTTYLLKDERGNPHAIFTGDTLFIGDVGRPDLAQAATGLTKEELAGWLYDSLRAKIMTLPDHVIVYPAHGAGSACGKNMSKETWSTLGAQKRTNYALREAMTREEFIREVTDGLEAPPSYFAENARLNKEGYDSIDRVMERGSRALSPAEFEAAANVTGALILDVRDKGEFVKGFIPNSIFIGLDGSFAPWVGALIPDLAQPILIVASMGREEETVMRLARVGYDNAIGYLQGGFAAWRAAGKEIDTIDVIEAGDLAEAYAREENLPLIDVRNVPEYAGGHIEGAVNVPLGQLSAHMHALRADTTYYLHCRSGYRSTVAASILKSRGFDRLVNVLDTFDNMQAGKLPITDAPHPSELVK